MQPPSGARPVEIGGCRIERLLGAGAFATVWLGFDPRLRDWVAIKVLAENWANDLRIRERFGLEARLLRRVDSPRLIRVHTVGELADGRPYIVMEWATGGSLRDLLETGDVPADTALRILGQVAAAVADLHTQGIVHRDLTPGNVLLCLPRPGDTTPATTGDHAPVEPPAVPIADAGAWSGGRIVVADLGLAKAMAAASGLTARAGTPGYMAPEQDDPSSTVDERADVYGMGRLGLRLFGPAGPPPGVAAVLTRAAAPAPAGRYRNADAFARALAEAATSRAGPERRRRRGSYRRTAAAALVLAAVVTAGAAAIDTWRDRPAPVATDASGRISVRLPPGWRAEGAGWAGRPAPGGGLAPAMVISPDPAHWVTDPDVPGAFIGLSDSRGAATDAADFLAEHTHPQCRADPVRTIRPADVEWTIARYAACPAGKSVIVEAAALLAGGTTLAYVQVTPPDAASVTFVDDLLGVITLRAG
ncbi:serine/threonine protein kinase [Micromonospora sp. KC606]|uniref:protein kinase domain-containing protein n=1 Tax=Micromonospora sp. KC606 TaxID=2530379 RepID=UPI00104AF486|nr:serine/threonine-protein kinase [Micromonospora sp. KC606]TDC72604.1 serine/threonine protein kinase [Micromonospora sp. KC606]